MDTVSKTTRSRIMSSVKQRDTGPEMEIRRGLHRRGYRYRVQVRDLPGSPDIVLPRYHAVVFVHGCFWHAHGCRLSRVPAERREFWTEKFRANKMRDGKNVRQLRAQGWRVLIVWQCAIKGLRGPKLESIVELIIKWIESQDQYRQIPGRQLRH